MVRHVIMLRLDLSPAGSIRAIVVGACLPNLRPDKFVGLDRTVTFDGIRYRPWGEIRC
jgi:hypothetical protein